MFSPKLIISPLSSTYAKSDITTIESPASYFCSTNHYAQQLNLERKYSISEAIYLASHQSNMKHDAKGCCSCDTIVGYYLAALRSVNAATTTGGETTIACTKELFDLIWRMTNLVLSHRETSKYQYLSWFGIVTSELWEFAKRLKEESYQCDLHVPMMLVKTSSSSSSSSSGESDGGSGSEYDDNEESYRRSIRITIYNCRALVYEQSSEFSQAIIYYRKCASVRPTPFESQQHLQQSALLAIQRLLQLFPAAPPKQRPTYSSFRSFDSASTTTTSSSSSISSRSSMCCSQCGIEKLAMPVCAKCKVQPYCSVRCMKSHKSVHVCGSKPL
ncbi:hypothetical protein HPULCUR_010626 [Helicostylum pulchrum]|uniref:MYND-type domain-containing protein n=1 Tax=Helicostylum pulchrum TaxID=562976 RepID=A0ABP9YDT5_9FUNG